MLRPECGGGLQRWHLRTEAVPRPLLGSCCFARGGPVRPGGAGLLAPLTPAANYERLGEQRKRRRPLCGQQCGSAGQQCGSSGAPALRKVGRHPRRPLRPRGASPLTELKHGAGAELTNLLNTLQVIYFWWGGGGGVGKGVLETIIGLVWKVSGYNKLSAQSNKT